MATEDFPHPNSPPPDEELARDIEGYDMLREIAHIYSTREAKQKLFGLIDYLSQYFPTRIVDGVGRPLVVLAQGLGSGVVSAVPGFWGLGFGEAEGSVVLQPNGANVRLKALDQSSEMAIANDLDEFTVQGDQILYLELEISAGADLDTATLSLESGTPASWPNPYTFDGDGKWTKYVYPLYEFVAVEDLSSVDQGLFAEIASGSGVPTALIPRHSNSPLVVHMINVEDSGSGNVVLAPEFIAGSGACSYLT